MKPPKILGIIGGIGEIGKIEKMERKPKEFPLLLIGTRLRDGIWKRKRKIKKTKNPE
jgi:hypothetical protein